MSLGTNIRRLRLAAGLRTQKACADLLDIPQPQLSDWENDRYASLELRNVLKLAKLFHCSVDELLAGVDSDYDRILWRDAAPAVETWPDIAVVAQGVARPERTLPNTRGEERPGIVGWLPRPADVDDPNAYAVRIRDESMRPAYRPNMIAIVSPEREVRDGDEVYVQLARGECWVRRARRVQDGYVLEPYNPACVACFAGHNEIGAMHVIVYSRRRGLER